MLIRSQDGLKIVNIDNLELLEIYEGNKNTNRVKIYFNNIIISEYSKLEYAKCVIDEIIEMFTIPILQEDCSDGIKLYKNQVYQMPEDFEVGAIGIKIEI